MKDGAERFYVTLCIPLCDADVLLANQLQSATKLLAPNAKYERTARIINGALEFTWTERS